MRAIDFCVALFLINGRGSVRKHRMALGGHISFTGVGTVLATFMQSALNV